MIKYFFTSTLILLWCLGFSVLWACICYLQTSRMANLMEPRPSRWRWLSVNRAFLTVFPVLLIAPVGIALAHRWLGVNLIYPSSLFADSLDLVVAAMVPAAILVFASGLVSGLRSLVASEFAFWSQKSFAQATLAYGGSLRGRLARVVLIKSLVQAWERSLPWVFGELLILECMFAAPGLGLEAWHMAKIRDLDGLWSSLGIMMVLYGGMLALNRGVHHWLGRRLEGYV